MANNRRWAPPEDTSRSRGWERYKQHGITIKIQSVTYHLPPPEQPDRTETKTIDAETPDVDRLAARIDPYARASTPRRPAGHPDDMTITALNPRPAYMERELCRRRKPRRR